MATWYKGMKIIVFCLDSLPVYYSASVVEIFFTADPPHRVD